MDLFKVKASGFRPIIFRSKPQGTPENSEVNRGKPIPVENNRMFLDPEPFVIDDSLIEDFDQPVVMTEIEPTNGVIGNNSNGNSEVRPTHQPGYTQLYKTLDRQAEANKARAERKEAVRRQEEQEQEVQRQKEEAVKEATRKKELIAKEIDADYRVFIEGPKKDKNRESFRLAFLPEGGRKQKSQDNTILLIKTLLPSVPKEEIKKLFFITSFLLKNCPLAGLKNDLSDFPEVMEFQSSFGKRLQDKKPEEFNDLDKINLAIRKETRSDEVEEKDYENYLNAFFTKLYGNKLSGEAAYKHFLIEAMKIAIDRPVTGS